MVEFKILLKVFCITILLILGIVALLIIGCMISEASCKKHETKTVAEIRGCNRHECAVKYSDGTKGYQSLPLIGDKVSVCVEE